MEIVNWQHEVRCINELANMFKKKSHPYKARATSWKRGGGGGGEREENGGEGKEGV